ncbi:hypothetical protein [Specibacter sp. RAF43]|uniref:hypothetical protein n=1 Tax=Specibacter sp. RAF43 TaxID=3233057 RepID=UPI003F99B909
MRNRPATRLAAVVLLGALLTVTVPMAAQAAEEPVPTASAVAMSTVEASSPATSTTAPSDAPVTVGAGELIAIGPAQVLEPGTAKSIAQLAIGEHITYTSLDRQDDFNAAYSVVTAMGQHGTVRSDFVVAMPLDGLRLDQPIVITKTAAAKGNVLSGFGGLLGAAAYDIFSAPTGEAEKVGSLLPGQKYLASKPLTGTTSLFGSSQWVVIQTRDAGPDAYAFIHAEAAAIDEHPGEVAVVTTPEPSETASAEATETASAEPTATPTQATPTATAAHAPVAEAPSAKRNTLPVIGLGAGAVVLIAIGSGVAAKRKRRGTKAATDGNAVTDEGPADNPASAATAEVLNVTSAATPSAVEDINWDEEN